MQPTDEQAHCVSVFNTLADMAIEAGAGAGKTTTLELLAKSRSARGTYAAFNRAIVDEARRKMPENIGCATAHSLAMRQTGHVYRHRLNGGRVRSTELARRLGLAQSFMRVDYGGEPKVVQPGTLASLTMRGVLNFCFSADEVPLAKHVPYVDGIDPPTDDGHRTFANNRLVAQTLEPVMRKAWDDLCKPDGSLPYGHDHYLKLWQLSDPVIPGEFVLFDEAQDAAPVMLDAVNRQHERGAQLVFVGDSQQQIYEWRGAVNALATIGGERTFLTQSFRFGPEIARVANLLLGRLDADLRITGLESIESRIEKLHQPHAVLCRSNAVAVSTVLRAIGEHRRVHLIGGGREVVAFARAARDLKEKGSTTYPDLMCFQSWGEVQEYVEQDPQGSDLALLVRLVDEFGVQTILTALGEMSLEEPRPEDVDVIVSTAHKSKGREWETVQLADDFSWPSDDALGEWRLLYVAATRAREVLDVSACEPLLDMLDTRGAQR